MTAIGGIIRVDSATAWSALRQNTAPDISVWLVRQGQRSVQELAQRLCPAERAQLTRFAAAEPAQEYAAAHSALRTLVGQSLGQSPECVLFAHPGDRSQSPLLRDTDALFPSLSHCAGYCAVALRRAGPVGVDIETLGRAVQTAAIPEQFLSDVELAALGAMPTTEAPGRSLALWCAKEAALKAAGTGFSIDPRSVTLEQDANPAVLILTRGKRRYLVRALAVRRVAGLEGAIASEGAYPSGTLCLTDLDWLLDQL